MAMTMENEQLYNSTALFWKTVAGKLLPLVQPKYEFL